ncbi:amino acid deaminase [Stackebrandtia soli]|uniref:amino acid deaminase n=1 Tax=Stackebrandtia soli TaxID=1892856 RepID=UPI0039E99515
MLNDTAFQRLMTEPLDWRFRSVPPSAYGASLEEWLASDPTVEELPSPVMTLDATALTANIAGMASWCAAEGLTHAPHGKTTMAPQLWRRQLESGAAAITLATPAQLRIAAAFGVPRVFLANEIVRPDALTWLAGWVADGADVVCFADSVDAVSIMDSILRSSGATLDVCVELGGVGGRAGAREHETALGVAAAIDRASSLRLVGVGGYEGSLAHDVHDADLAIVDDFTRRLVRLHEALDYPVDRPIVTVGGSQYFDQIADAARPLIESGVEVVLRAGSYIAHDHGMYAGATPAARHRNGPALTPALTVRAGVLSLPEPGLALLDVGRRDVPFDAGFPIPLDLPHAAVVALNDQHAHVRGDLDGVNVGDIVRLGISHPCTAFDRWNLIPVVSDDGSIVDAVRTYF